MGRTLLPVFALPQRRFLLSRALPSSTPTLRRLLLLRWELLPTSSSARVSPCPTLPPVLHASALAVPLARNGTVLTVLSGLALSLRVLFPLTLPENSPETTDGTLRVFPLILPLSLLTVRLK